MMGDLLRFDREGQSMPFDPKYHEDEPTRDEVNRLPGPVLVEFGASWCPICQGFAPRLKELLDQYPRVRHIRIEDGPGKPLGRSFRVKLWPNLVFLRDGEVIEQLARPTPEEARKGLEAITASP